MVVTDVGQHQMWEAQYYHHEQPRSLITSGGLGTMGFALPAAIGAKIARPDAEVWAVVGDGGFQMTLCELATIAQERLKINIAIINNGYLGMVRQWQEFFYERRYAATPLHNPDFVRLAEAYGLQRAVGHDASRRRSGDRGGATRRPRGADRLPRRAGRLGVPDGAGRRRSARDDPAAVSHCRNRRDCELRNSKLDSEAELEPFMLTTLLFMSMTHPGVLNRVASLFRRRAFNIASLTVGHTDEPGVSRMTIVVDADMPPERIEANLYKLIDVRRVEVLPPRHVGRARSRDDQSRHVAGARAARSCSWSTSSARASSTSRRTR